MMLFQFPKISESLAPRKNLIKNPNRPPPHGSQIIYIQNQRGFCCVSLILLVLIKFLSKILFLLLHFSVKSRFDRYVLITVNLPHCFFCCTFLSLLYSVGL